jgi:phage terminase large subunit-like protein
MKLCGDIRQDDGLGQGMIPLDSILGISRSRGIDAFLDTVTVRRESGGTAIIQFKTYEMGSSQFQGSAVDEILLDEDCGFSPQVDIWKHCLARFQTTSGRLIWSATPIPGLGRTPWRKRFSEERNPDRLEVVMGIDEVDHISETDKEKVKLRWANDPNKNLVLYGADATGGGSVFNFPREAISHDRNPASFPSWYRWAWSFDFSHGGASESAHPFGAVLCAHDQDADVIYVVECIRLHKMLAVQHIARILEHPMYDAVVLWPHDGTQAELGGGTIADIYRRGGLNMRDSWTTFADGGYNFQGGIAAM